MNDKVNEHTASGENETKAAAAVFTNHVITFQSITAAVFTFGLLLFTSSLLPPTWDEGFVNDRAGRIPVWYLHVFNQIPVLRNVVPETPEYQQARQDETLSMLLSDWGIDTYWCDNVEGHPHWPVFLASFQNIAPSCLAQKERVRFGNILFFSLAIGVVFYRLRSDVNGTTAFFGVASILLLPRVFTHAQITTWDSPLMASWLLCWAFFPSALKNVGGALLFGGAVGLACSSKFPGFAVAIPVLVWLLLRLVLDRTFFQGRRLVLLQRALIVLIVAFQVFIFLNPPLWPDIVYGIGKFFRLNMNRDINVAIVYFGRMYDLHHSLPWTNTLVWTAITVPIGLLFLFFAGLFDVFRNREKRWPGLFLLLNFLTLIVIRACPGTPVHDGVRLFVAAFPFLGILAGIGAASLWNISDRKRIVARLTVATVYAACVLNMFWYAPQWLSYYNFVIGGLPGAVRAGMEPTYYWDGCDSEVIAWLNAHTEPGETVAFGDWAGVELAFKLYGNNASADPRFRPVMRRQPVYVRDTSKVIRYYVHQRRPSSEFKKDTWLIHNAEPVFVKTIRKGGWGPWKLGSVPIIEIYDLREPEERK